MLFVIFSCLETRYLCVNYLSNICVALAPILPQTGQPGTGPGRKAGKKTGKAPVPGEMPLIHCNATNYLLIQYKATLAST